VEAERSLDETDVNSSPFPFFGRALLLLPVVIHRGCSPVRQCPKTTQTICFPFPKLGQSFFFRCRSPFLRVGDHCFHHCRAAGLAHFFPPFFPNREFLFFSLSGMPVSRVMVIHAKRWTVLLPVYRFLSLILPVPPPCRDIKVHSFHRAREVFLFSPFCIDAIGRLSFFCFFRLARSWPFSAR